MTGQDDGLDANIQKGKYDAKRGVVRERERGDGVGEGRLTTTEGTVTSSRGEV